MYTFVDGNTFNDTENEETYSLFHLRTGSMHHETKLPLLYVLYVCRKFQTIITYQIISVGFILQKSQITLSCSDYSLLPVTRIFLPKRKRCQEVRCHQISGATLR